MQPTKKKMVWMLERMALIRAFEDIVIPLFRSGKLPGFLHTYQGQEAVPVGMCADLTDADYITSTHRGHGEVISKGADVKRMMAELFAKETGYCRAKGGSMHVADLKKGILGAMGIVGGGIPMAGGAALSAQMRGTDQVVVSFFGDGASNEGAFHETINLASVWDLPVVFVCVNNLYALSTSHRSEMKIDDISVRAQAYGIPGVTVNGMDVLEVYEAGREAIRRARRGEGPALIECKTYRYLGHHAGDPGVYRTKEELERYKNLDPIPAFRKRLVEMGVLTEKKADRIMAEAQAKIDEAIEFAEASPDPKPEEALEDVFV